MYPKKQGNLWHFLLNLTNKNVITESVSRTALFGCIVFRNVSLKAIIKMLFRVDLWEQYCNAPHNCGNWAHATLLAGY